MIYDRLILPQAASSNESGRFPEEAARTDEVTKGATISPTMQSDQALASIDSESSADAAGGSSVDQLSAAREKAKIAAQAFAVQKRNANRDNVKYSVDALKAAAEAESKCKHNWSDSSHNITAMVCWIRSDRCIEVALSAENTPAKIKKALEPKHVVVKQRLKQLKAKLSTEEIAQALAAFEEEEVASVREEVEAALVQWD
eukprot:SAG31_NODE_8207_length_1496_cov_1.983536_1_plen_200_part_10